MKSYIKHLIECNCVLPQYKNQQPLVFHRFVVFSVIEETGLIKPSFAQCNNCGAIHKVVEVGQSIQQSKEFLRSLPTIEDIKTTIPQNVAQILENYKVDLPTWQEVQFIYNEQQWGKPVILTKEEVDGMIVGKYLLILGQNLYKVDGFSDGEE